MSLRDERWTVMMNGVSDEVEVYDKLNDATEERNLGVDSLDEDALGGYKQLFNSSISAMEAAPGDGPALPDEVKEVLSAMGYVR